MTQAQLQLGEFRLVAPIGEGGFSRVWLATHPESRTRFAVKILRGDFAANRASQQAFVREADAVARLSHPNVVLLHDYGEVSEAEAESSGGRLLPGSPWLAMEYFPSGSVQEHGALPWPAMHSMLVQVLAGLAHAHARSVLHLDVKPQNVLRHVVAGGTEYVVTDFGTAALLDRIALVGGKREHTEGTPLFMAPERLFGREFDEGPWSDVYSVAVMAWVLLAGKSPFAARGASDIMNAHVREGIPVLPYEVDVPAPFHAWLARAAQRDPARRFRSASEARAALIEAVGDADASATATAAPAVRDVEPGEGIYATTLFVAERPVAPLLPTTRAARAETVPVRIPIPEQAPDDTGHSTPRLTYGAGLIGRREAPLVGRGDERTALWSQFREAMARGAPRLVVLEGAAGAGKTRLGRWLLESAAEHCGALALMATHSELGAPDDGLAAMLARGLRARVHDASELQLWSTQIHVAMGASNVYDIDTVADLLAPAVLRGETRYPWRVRLKDRRERHEVIERLLRRIATTRPLVVLLDDIQWAPSALQLVEQLVVNADTRHFPVLLVLTCRTETRDEDPETWQRIEAIGERSLALRLAVPPQPVEDIVQIVQSTFAIENHSARVLAARSGGSPLMALQLLDEWYHSGALERVKGGWALRDQSATGADATLSDLWEHRVDRALASIEPAQRDDALLAVERAAALGTNVAETEWSALCADLDPAAVEAALDALQAAGLCILRPGVWSFAHALLPDAIEKRAARAGRAAGHHRAIAEFLAKQPNAGSVAVLDRRSAHLERGGAFAAAFDALQILLDVDALTELVAWRFWIRRMERCFAQMPVAEQTGRAALLRIRRLQFELFGVPDGEQRRSACAELRHSPEVAADPVAVWDLDLFEMLGLDGYSDAHEYTRRARDLYARAEQMGDASRLLRAASELVTQLDTHGFIDELEEVCSHLRRIVPEHLRATYAFSRVLHSLVHASFDNARFAEGVEALHELDDLVRAGGTRELLSSTWMLRCEALIRYGAFEAAALALDEAADIAYTTANNRDVLCHVHRCALFARSDDHDACLASLEAARSYVARPRSRGLIVCAVGYACYALAATGDTARWDELVPAAIADCRAWSMREAILARCFADAARCWLARGDRERATHAYDAGIWMLHRDFDTPARERLMEIFSSAGAESVPNGGPRFLDEVSKALDGVPDWLLEPYER